MSRDRWKMEEEEADGDGGQGRKKPALEWGRGEVGEDGRNEEGRKAQVEREEVGGARPTREGKE